MLLKQAKKFFGVGVTITCCMKFKRSINYCNLFLIIGTQILSVSRNTFLKQKTWKKESYVSCVSCTYSSEFPLVRLLSRQQSKTFCGILPTNSCLRSCTEQSCPSVLNIQSLKKPCLICKKALSTLCHKKTYWLSVFTVFLFFF